VCFPTLPFMLSPLPFQLYVLNASGMAMLSSKYRRFAPDHDNSQFSRCYLQLDL
jgi:hypothetical protein